MGEVIEFKLERVASVELIYCWGETIIANANGRVFFDTDGTPILLGEFYRVTPKGIERIE